MIMVRNTVKITKLFSPRQILMKINLLLATKVRVVLVVEAIRVIVVKAHDCRAGVTRSNLGIERKFFRCKSRQFFSVPK